MSSHKPVPTSIRYIKARLKSLMRPAFWCSSVVLLLVVLFAWEYFTHPEWLSAISNDQESEGGQAADSTNLGDNPPSQKDIAAIGADIDSSSVLQTELEQSHPIPPINVGDSKSQVGGSEGLLEKFSRQQSPQPQTSTTPPLGIPVPGASDTSIYRQNFTNPFVSSAQDLLNIGAFTTSDRSTSPSTANLSRQNQSTTSFPGAAANVPSVGVNNFNSANPNQSATAISPLEAALKQTAQTTNLNNPSATIQTPASTPGQTFSTPTYTGQTGIQPAVPVSPSTASYIPPNASSISPPASSPDPTQPQSVPGIPPTTSTTPSVAPVPSSYTPSYNTPYSTQSGVQPNGASNYSPYTYPSPNQGATSNIPPLYSSPSQNQGQYSGGRRQ